MVSGTNCSSPPLADQLQEVTARQPVLRDVERHGGRPRAGHRADAGRDHRGGLDLGRDEVGLRRRGGHRGPGSSPSGTPGPGRRCAVVLTNSATSSPGTALTWLAKPSSAWSGWTWLQIQFSVPGLAFSAISHGAVGTMTPLGSFVSTTAGVLRRCRRLARAGTRCFGCLAPGGWRRRTRRRRARRAAGTARRSMAALATGAARGRSRRPVGGAARHGVYPRRPRCSSAAPVGAWAPAPPTIPA